MRKPIASFKLFKASLLIITVFLFMSCGKSNNDSSPPPQNDYYFRAKLNGVLKDFKHTAHCFYGEKNGNIVSIDLSGYESKYDPSKPIEETPYDFQIEIFRYDMANISPRLYSVAEAKATHYNYYRVNGERHIQTKDQGTIQYDEDGVEDFVVVITELSKEKGLKGTFKGHITRDRAPKDVINVTEGEFYLPYSEEILNP